MSVTRHTLPDHQNTLTKEWIVTNGLGGYASSTVIGTNTRRYHGLLVAAFNPPTGRKVMVSKVEETIYCGNEEVHLSTNQYPDTVYPEGYHHIKQFTREPLPTTWFKAGGAELLKTIFMVFNSNTSIVEYKNKGEKEFILRLNPLFGVRDYHGLLHEEHDYHFFLKNNKNEHSLYAYAGAEPLYFKHTKGIFTEQRYWNKNIFYALEKLRGQDYLEDLYSTGYIECTLHPGESMFLMFSVEEGVLATDPEELKTNELNRISELVPSRAENEFLKDLIISGEQFIVHRKSTENYSIIAGYHWFTDWGRDSMIALRGLCIATGKQKEAKSVIITFLKFLNQGLIPNRFTDYENECPEYHTIDATLWLFIAVYEYDQKFDDIPFLKNIYEKLKEIIDRHIEGTLHNIHVTEKGLLSGGTPGLPLTWMDARINDHVFTPRTGYAVEINALWYNALRIFEHVSVRLEKKSNHSYKALIYKIENNFEEMFWNPKGYLNDSISETGEVSQCIRPNQIYAVSLPFTLLAKSKEEQVVNTVRKYLVTPYGLRTLAVNDPQFKPLYSGDVWARDAAYHQGTVWPFLLPEYYTAVFKINQNSSLLKKDIASELKKLKEHFYYDECLNGISEVFDGSAPRSGKGCMQQAWSVSNLILLILKFDLEI
ncbi:MAG: glycogen debranching enzyme N-terminal domain-containing protein [Bacteroidetes bacterium]|nr:glycogen debranching enzyme N-terminal domain-containing protein [Bacteroidota bacterium]